MSRRAFRVAVRGPRPLGAIGMVTAASATLAVSGQVVGWTLALQAVAIASALLLRRHPQAWQRSAPILNLGLLGVCVAALLHYGDGQPATVALAHFAMLAQGLQLLDARPRHSEFPLVTLALFQVVLASNLTDSVFFPVLLVTFLLTTVWTLVVHTLAQEAFEAGEAGGAQRVATPALLRTTLLASIASIALAFVFFLLLPRMRSSLVRAVAPPPGVAISGFSDRVQLGDIGRIRADPSRALRVQTLRGNPPSPASAYWRGLALDHFDGRVWSLTSPGRQRVPGLAQFGVDLGPAAPPANLVQRIVREPTEAGVLFAAGMARRLRGAIGRVERDRNRNLYAPHSIDARLDYIIESRAAAADDRPSDDDIATRPRGEDTARLVALPPLSEAVRALSLRITNAARTDAERAAALEHHLRKYGRYSDTPPILDASDPKSPVEIFLFHGLAGHCEYFATAMAVLGRSIGLPTRLVTGFAGGRENSFGGFVDVAHSDAHAWVEVHFERAGWVRYDPTPPDLRLRAGQAASLAEQLLEIASAIEYWYYDRVVDFDRNDQIRALMAGWRAWRRLRAQTSRERDTAAGRATWRETLSRRPSANVLPALAAVAVALLALRLGRRRRPSLEPCSAHYRAALRLLERRRGLIRPPSRTPRAFARQVRSALPDAAAKTFSELTESYLAERYGGRPPSRATLRLRRLRRDLRRR